MGMNWYDYFGKHLGNFSSGNECIYMYQGVYRKVHDIIICSLLKLPPNLVLVIVEWIYSGWGNTIQQ